MLQSESHPRERGHRQWARRMEKSIQAVLAEHPDADPDNIRHTLILLDLPPIERLRRSLIRGRFTAAQRR